MTAGTTSPPRPKSAGRAAVRAGCGFSVRFGHKFIVQDGNNGFVRAAAACLPGPESALAAGPSCMSGLARAQQDRRTDAALQPACPGQAQQQKSLMAVCSELQQQQQQKRTYTKKRLKQRQQGLEPDLGFLKVLGIADPSVSYRYISDIS